MTQTYMDETGKSYYGEMSLFHFEVKELIVFKKINFKNRLKQKF